MPWRPKEEDSHEVAPTVLAHTSPTVVSAAVTALLKITVGHLVVPYSFAIWEQKSDKTVIDILVYCCKKKRKKKGYME